MKLILCICFFPFLVFAQDRISPEAFLQKGLTKWVKDSPVLADDVRLPWIEEIDLRTESDEFLLRRQEYTLRLSPTSLGIRKAQRELMQHIWQQPDFDLKKAYVDQVYTIHRDFLDLYLIGLNLDLLEQLKLNIEDRKLVQEKQIVVGTVDFPKLVDLIEDKSDLEISLHSLHSESKMIKEQYQLENESVDFTSLFSLAEMALNIDESLFPTPDSREEEYLYDLEKIRKELNLERVEHRKIFDFAQVKYRGPHSNEFDERLTVGLGLRINRDGAGKLKIKELEREEIALKQKKTLDQRESLRALIELKRKFKNEYEGILLYDQIVEEEIEELESIEEKIRLKDGFNPLLILDINQRKIQIQQNRLAYIENLYRYYIDILEQRGDLNTDLGHILLCRP